MFESMKAVGNFFAYKVKFKSKEPELLNNVNQYKGELIDWFRNGTAQKENPMSTVTQSYWYSLYLEKKRLEQHRIKLDFAAFNHVYKRKDSSTLETFFSYRKDGKNMLSKADQWTDIDKVYLRDNRVIFRDKKVNSLTFIMLSSQDEEGQYICPKCGASQPLQNLLDGCDYCGAKYHISTYKDKIVSTFMENQVYMSRQLKKSSYFLTMMSMPCWAFALYLAAFGSTLCQTDWYINGRIILAIAGLVFFTLGMISVYSSGNGKHNRALKHLNKTENNFCEESMLAAIDSKIKAIHYASNYGEIATFVKCNNMNAYLQEYQNTVICDTGAYCMEKAWVENGYQYIQLKRELNLQDDFGDRFGIRKEYLRLTIARKLGAEVYNDVSIYTCKECGATISLVEGGKCEYCGNELNLIDYDWVITKYEKINKM